jgi:phage terminase large subunit
MALVLPNPHKKQAELLADNHRYKVLNWGRRTGKSVVVWEKVVLEGILRQGTYYIVAPTYKQAKEIYWRDIIKRYKGEFMTFNEQELSVTFDILKGVTIPTTAGDITVDHREDLPPTRIVLKGADNPDSLRGTGISGVVMDEYAFMPEGKYVWDTIIQASLVDRDGWAIFISTPNGRHNHFYDLVKLAQAQPDLYYYSHATSLDNPYIPKKEFENLRRQYEFEGKIDQFHQEFMAEFSNPHTLVYNDFDANVHTLPGAEFDRQMPSEGTHNLTIDFGMTDPTAGLFVFIDYDNNWWIYDEVYKTDLDLEPLIQALRDKMADNRFVRILGDGAARFELESLRRRGFRITGSKKGADSIANGIKELKAFLPVREGTGKPKLFIRASCKNTIREFESYSWETDDTGEVTNKPEDKNNHALDALRYLALDKAVVKQKTKRKREYDPVTGRLLN